MQCDLTVEGQRIVSNRGKGGWSEEDDGDGDGDDDNTVRDHTRARAEEGGVKTAPCQVKGVKLTFRTPQVRASRTEISIISVILNNTTAKVEVTLLLHIFPPSIYLHGTVGLSRDRDSMRSRHARPSGMLIQIRWIQRNDFHDYHSSS